MADGHDTTWIVRKSEADADGGMVAAMHPLAAAAGLEILKAGGNAVDAAVATAFAIGVVEPFMSGVGGVAAMVFFEAGTGRSVVIDGSSRAPRAAHEDVFDLEPPGGAAGMYGWRSTVGNAQNVGYRSPIVPGMPAAMLHALEAYGSGRITRQQALAPAIRLAEEGFAVDPYVAATTAFEQRKLRAFPETMRIFFQEDGTPFTPGGLSKAPDRLVQADLARTLRLLAQQGSDVLYHGELGDRLAADLEANGSLIVRDDLRDYRVRELEPLRAEYRGYTLLGIPQTSGCVTAYQALNVLENFDLASLGQGSPEAAHLIAEACRRAFLDRFAYLADPEDVAIPFEGMLSKEYARTLAAKIDPNRAAPEAIAGDPWPYGPGGHASAGALGGAVADVAPRATGGDGCTTHLTVVDKDRNVVSLTSTLGEIFGSGVVPRGTGILLNDGMTWFDPQPGHVNSIESGKRILWAPSPTIVLKDGRPLVGLGAPGGRRIMSAVVQSLVNLLDFGLGIQDAVSAPRVHCEGPTTQAEGRLGRATLDGLAARGHHLRVVHEDSQSFSFARPNGIRIDPATNRLTGGVNQHVPAVALGH